MSAISIVRYFPNWQAFTAASVIALLPGMARGGGYTAGDIMKNMSGQERFSFVAGVVEGLAMARFTADGKKPDGMKCIYDWFYDNKDSVDTVYAAFQRYPDYPPGTVVDVLIRKTCPG